MKKYFLPIIIIIILVLIATVRLLLRPPGRVLIQIGENKIYATLAITDNEKQKGLGGIAKIPDNEGMLFVYREAEKYPFWMKDMNFPLDFIWIKDREVVELTRNVPVNDDGKWSVINPENKANMILEVNAGTIDKLSITTGSSVLINNK